MEITNETHKNIAMSYFEPWLCKIIDKYYLRDFARYAIDKAPDAFFVKPASSSGKYHPEFAQGEGGLVRHVVKALEVYDDLWRALDCEVNELNGVTYSVGLISVLVHDCCKYGKDGLNEYTDHEHDEIGAGWILEQARAYYGNNIVPKVIDDISSCIQSHHGKWSTNAYPTRMLNKIVFLSDYIASRKWVKLGVE